MFQTHSLQKMIRNEELVRKHEASSWTSQAWFNRCSEVSTRSLAGEWRASSERTQRVSRGKRRFPCHLRLKWPKMTCLARINLMNMLNGRCAPPGEKGAEGCRLLCTWRLEQLKADSVDSRGPFAAEAQPDPGRPGLQLMRLPESLLSSLFSMKPDRRHSLD